MPPPFCRLVTGFDDLRRGPDQNVCIPDRRHAVFRHGFDTNCDRTGTDRHHAFRLGERKERVSHQILRVAGREITGQSPKEFELVALGMVSAPHGHCSHAADQRRSWPAHGRRTACFLAGSTVPFQGSDIDVLAPRSAHAFMSSTA